MLAIADALRLTRRSAVAFVGAGGKTTALAAVSRSLAPCFAAATSHLGDWQAAFADHHITWPDPASGSPPAPFPAGGIVLVTGEPDVQPHRLRGISLEQAATLCVAARARGWPVFFEADGSRRLPLKAPARHEPPVPLDVDLVVIVAGLSGLGHRLDAEHVHRPDRFAALAGCAAGTRLTPEVVARVLVHPEGGLRNAPPGARRVVLLNQADTPDRRAAARDLASRLLPHVDAVVIASLAGGTGDPNHPWVADPVFAVLERDAGTTRAAGQP